MDEFSEFPLPLWMFLPLEESQTLFPLLLPLFLCGSTCAVLQLLITAPQVHFSTKEILRLFIFLLITAPQVVHST